MVTKKLFKKLGAFALVVWCLVEVCHQFYLHSTYVKNGYYDWESYAINRNKATILLIEKYISQDTIKHFVYSKNPNQGTLNGLPDSVKAAINKLNNDLTWGINLTKAKKKFAIYFNRPDETRYVIGIEAGANFKSSYNGYNFDMVISNRNIPPNEYEKYVKFENSHLYIEKETNKKYRSASLLLRYNCNSYDLLILKLFR